MSASSALHPLERIFSAREKPITNAPLPLRDGFHKIGRITEMLKRLETARQETIDPTRIGLK